MPFPPEYNPAAAGLLIVIGAGVLFVLICIFVTFLITTWPK